MHDDLGLGIGYQVFESLPESTREAFLNPSTRTIGQALNGLVLFFTSPLLKFGIVKKAELEKFKNDIQQQTTKIPEENRDRSKLGLVIKAIEDAKYQLNEEDIRSMYAKLIASTVDNRKNNSVTPRLATAVSQMGPNDALLLRHIKKQGYVVVPFGYLTKKDGEGFFPVTKKSIDFLKTGTLINQDVSLDVLDSLGIIKMWTDVWLVDDLFKPSYKRLESSLMANVPNEFQTSEIEFTKGYLKVTDFGEALLQCIF